MSGGVKPIRLLPDEDQLKRNVEDTEYWMRMKELAVFQEHGIVTSVAFTPKLPHHLAATNSNKASLFDTSIAQPIWFQSKFKSNVYGVRFRKDGLLMGMGSTDGYIRFFDIQQKNIPSRHAIRLFKAHDSEVRTIAFTSALHACASFADDGDIRLWDLSLATNNEPLWKVNGAHSDRIRAAATSTTTDNILVSGSYDHTVKLWDTRAKAKNSPLVTIDHGHPVETLLFHANNRIVISGGGNVVKFWDVTTGANKPLKVLENHSRTVTALCFSSNGNFLLSAGLDRRIHAYRIDRGEFTLVNTLKTSAPVLALDIAPNDECMGFAMNNLMCIYRRHPKHHSFAEDTTNKVLIGDGVRSSNARPDTVYQQEIGSNAVQVGITAKHVKQLHLGIFDNLLRTHQYRKIVDQLFSLNSATQKRPEIIVAVLEQMRLSSQLRLPLSGRQGKELGRIIRFVSQYLFHPAFFDTLFEVTNTLITVYADETHDKDTLVPFAFLLSQIRNELTCERLLLKSLGIMNSLVNVSFERTKSLRDSSSTDAVFGDLLITPKLFTLRQTPAAVITEGSG